jgi:hypothetical protein
MKLSVADRIHLLDILPAEGSFIAVKIARQLREDLSFSEEELERFGIVQDGQAVSWTSDEPKDVEIGKAAERIIADALKAKDSSGKLTEAYISLYETFVGEA